MLWDCRELGCSIKISVQSMFTLVLGYRDLKPFGMVSLLTCLLGQIGKDLSLQ